MTVYSSTTISSSSQETSLDHLISPINYQGMFVDNIVGDILIIVAILGIGLYILAGCCMWMKKNCVDDDSNSQRANNRTKANVKLDEKRHIAIRYKTVKINGEELYSS